MGNRNRNAPTVQVGEDYSNEDSPAEETSTELTTERLKELVAEAIAEHSEADRDKLVEAICAAIVDDIKSQVLSKETIHMVMKQLNATLSAQAQNVADRAVDSMATKYQQHMEAQKMSGLAKAGIVVGGAVTIATVYALGRYNGKKIGHLERG